MKIVFTGAILLMASITIVSANSNPGPATGGDTNRSYDDGFVFVDNSGDAGGFTWNWGYQSASQIQGNSLVFHSESTVDANTIEIISDTYSLAGLMSVPSPVYSGSFDGPGPLMPDAPFSRSIQDIAVPEPSANVILLLCGAALVVMTNFPERERRTDRINTIHTPQKYERKPESRIASFNKAKGKFTSFGLCSLLIMLSLFTDVYQVSGQGTRYFRITGPAVTKITAFRPDGTIVWTNGLPGTNYTIQTASSLLGGTNWVSYVQVPVTNPVNTNQIVAFNPPAGMTLIPAGMFTMGDSLDGESDAIPTVSVTVSAFYMDVNLVSYAQWQSVYNWATTNGYSFDDAGAGEATNHPVQSVNWYDVVKWSNARSQQAGLTPVYYTDPGLTQVYENGDTDAVFPNWAANGYRLPTEAECQKAARGGLNDLRFPWGDTIDWSHANYYSEWTGAAPTYAYDLAFTSGYDPAFTNGETAFTSPVGYFAPNGYGLYDMAGNVQVWCWDWYAAPPYPTGSPYLGGTDPRGPASSPDGDRVLHGGFFTYGLRCAKRSTDSPSFLINHNGLRCVRNF